MLARSCYKGRVPKLIDHQQRRNAIVDALFDVLREGGFAKVSLATVADRAGLAIGSVRHFLGTREEMIGFAFDTVAERFHRRVLANAQALNADLDKGRLDAEARLDATADLLCEFLPLDTARRDEAIVWIEFETAARTDAQLAATSQRAAAQTSQLIETIMRSAQQRGAISPQADTALETTRLTALIDGLTTRAVLHPQLLNPGTARKAVVAHLRELRQSTSDVDDPSTSRLAPAADNP